MAKHLTMKRWPPEKRLFDLIYSPNIASQSAFAITLEAPLTRKEICNFVNKRTKKYPNSLIQKYAQEIEKRKLGGNLKVVQTGTIYSSFRK